MGFDYLRLKAFPFSDSVREFFDAHDHVYVVEQNRDGQMASLLRNEMPEITGKIRSLVHYDGMPIAARTVSAALAKAEGLR